jgi:chaperone BCS1
MKDKKKHLFYALMIYLGSNAFSTASVPQRVMVGKNENIKALPFSLDRNCKIVDNFHGVDMKWTYCSELCSTPV